MTKSLLQGLKGEGLEVLDVFCCFLTFLKLFPSSRVVLYTVFMAFSLSKTLVKTLAKNIIKTLAKNLAEILSDKLTENSLKNKLKRFLKTSLKLLAKNPKLQINQSACESHRKSCRREYFVALSCDS